MLRDFPALTTRPSQSLAALNDARQRLALPLLDEPGSIERRAVYVLFAAVSDLVAATSHCVRLPSCRVRQIFSDVPDTMLQIVVVARASKWMQFLQLLCAELSQPAILALDSGPAKSALVRWEDSSITPKLHADNARIHASSGRGGSAGEPVVIEQRNSRGRAELFQTVFW